MIIYAKYDDDDTIDAIYVPDNPQIDFTTKQNEFFTWLFNKSNNHEFWREINGEKAYCEYNAGAFVKWLNLIAYQDISDKAKIVTQSTLDKELNSIVLIF